MDSAYKILDVAMTADDAEIKLAYLRLVKDNPPDRDQQKFQAIHAAYSAIKDHKSRVTYALFTLPDMSADTLIDRALATEKNIPINTDLLTQLLSASVDDATLLKAITPAEK